MDNTTFLYTNSLNFSTYPKIVNSIDIGDAVANINMSTLMCDVILSYTNTDLISPVTSLPIIINDPTEFGSVVNSTALNNLVLSWYGLTLSSSVVPTSSYVYIPQA